MSVEREPEPTISLSPAQIRDLTGTATVGLTDEQLREAAHTFLATEDIVWWTVREWADQVVRIATASATR